MKNGGKVGECACKVDLLSDDQLLERDEAVKLGINPASKQFFHYVLYEKIFKYGNHIYHFMEHETIVFSK